MKWLLIYYTYRVLTADCMDDERLIELLKHHEGVRNFPYLDTAEPPNITIGVGRNLSSRGITAATIEQMLCEDIEIVRKELDSMYPDWKELTESRQLVLASMAFNMGGPTLATFSRFFAALRQGDWEKAADEMIQSKWYNQIGNRGPELVGMMRDG